MESVQVANVGIKDFVAGLEALGEENFAARCTDYVLGSAPIDLDSLAPYAFFVANRYTRNLIFKNQLFEVMALCWEPGQVSNIHNHRDQQCWMLLAQGQLENQNYQVRDRDPERGTCRLEESARFRITQGSPMAVDDDEPVHQIRNLAEFGERAVSVHIYSRPFDVCEVYCPDKGIYRDVQLSYWSEYGQLVGKPAPDPCAD